MEIYTHPSQRNSRTLESPRQKSTTLPSIHEILQSSRNTVRHWDYPILFSRQTGRPVMQMFKLVQPANIGYNHAPALPGQAQEAMFSTHKVVHSIPTGNTNAIPMAAPTLSGIDPVAENNIINSGNRAEQAQTHLENIRQIQNQLQAAIVLPAVVPQLRNTMQYFNTLNVMIPAQRIINILQSILPLAQIIQRSLPLFTPLINIIESETKTRFGTFFQTQGRTADPQPPGARLGQIPYQVINPGGVAMPNPIPAGYNTLDANSVFHVVPVRSNVQFPMLVSSGNQFAINAVYSDPKEAYLSPGAAMQANATLAGVQPNNAPNGSSSCQLIPFGNQVTIGGNVLAMHKPEFRYQPHGQQQQVSRETAITNACDRMRSRYYPPGNAGLHTNGIGLNNNLRNLPNSRVPWTFHTAGTLCQDGSDSISLENGARLTWLIQRGMNAGNQAFINQQQDIDDEMNKTWYFRIYGSENLGQDIREQTISRF